MTVPEPVPQRGIRSFVRREGRITDGQQQALKELWPRFGIAPSDGLLELPALFGRCAPVTLEIGCGDGGNLFALAQQHPEEDFIGIEVYRPGLGSLVRKLANAGLSNVRLADSDAVAFLCKRIAPRSLAAIHILFPDPWPKKRHHKRRLIQPAFAALLAEKLQGHGRLYLATDWPDYAQHMLDVLSGQSALLNLAGPNQFAPRPYWRPETKYERRARRLGHPFFDVVLGLA
jgi:tRNA (guanine-N7-)-methyltransferase